MNLWLNHFNGVESFFVLCAVAGGIFVALRMVLLVIGIETAPGTDLEINVDDIDLHHADSDIGFKLISLQSLSSFLLMFGLVGLALYRENKAGFFLSLAGAILAGLAAVWTIGKLFALFQKLQSSGTILPEDTLGARGKVYLTIPKNGTGRVLVQVRDRLREYDARSSDNTTLETGKPVEVVRHEGTILVVAPR